MTIGFLEMLLLAAVGVPCMVLAAGAVWLLARLIRERSDGSDEARQSLGAMREGMLRMEARLESLEDVMIDPATSAARRKN